MLNVLREYKEPINWTLANTKGINLIDCMHRIHLDENAKSIREMQRRLNLKIKEMIRFEILKLLKDGIIYLFLIVLE